MAATAAALLVLAGCSSETGNDDAAEEAVTSFQERVTFEEVALPEELTSTSRGVGSWSVLPQDGDQPRLAVTRSFDGKADLSNVSIWQATGDDVMSEVGEVEVEGDVSSTHVASAGGLTAIAGRTVIDGHARGYLLTSTDRTTWQTAELSEQAAAAVGTWVAVADGSVYLLGYGPDGRAPQLAVYNTEDGTESVTALPAPADNENATLSGLAATGQRVIAITEIGPVGEDLEPVAHVSTDGGKTVTSAGMGGAGFDVNGVVAAGDVFVAAGSVRTGSYAKPSAWSSPDGVAWSVDDIASALWSWDPLDWAEGRFDVEFTRPVYDAKTNTLAATVVTDSNPWTGLTLRLPDGTWTIEAYARPNGVTPTVTALWDGGTLRTLSSFSGGAAGEEVWDLEEYGSDFTKLVDYAVEPHGMTATDLGGEVGVSAWRYHFGDSGDVITNSVVTEQFMYSPDADLAPENWAPSAAGEDFMAAGDPETGTVVGVAGRASQEAFTMGMWLRDESGQWSESETIDAAEFQSAATVAHGSAGWLVGGVVAETSHATDWRTAQVWVSPDGKQWNAPEVEHPFPDGRGSRIRGFCDTEIGPVAAGYADDAEGTRWATTWRQVDGAWHAVLVTETAGTWADSCVASDDGVVAYGGDGVTSLSWRSTDGQAYEESEKLDVSQRRTAVVEVPGGYAAGGAVLSEEHYGDVLWLSPDAETWDWVPLPAGAVDSSYPHVAVAGDDLLVLRTASMSAWRVPDIASVFAE